MATPLASGTAPPPGVEFDLSELAAAAIAHDRRLIYVTGTLAAVFAVTGVLSGFGPIRGPSSTAALRVVLSGVFTALMAGVSVYLWYRPPSREVAVRLRMRSDGLRVTKWDGRAERAPWEIPDLVFALLDRRSVPGAWGYRRLELRANHGLGPAYLTEEARDAFLRFVEAEGFSQVERPLHIRGRPPGTMLLIGRD